mmetsp:Transcript_2294/g.3943  ORF Transcript_2294/g.3943 Transcript_2294/m.3943 type:complete len:516 (-) Transcript_2294:564-2111(-)
MMDGRKTDGIIAFLVFATRLRCVAAFVNPVDEAQKILVLIVSLIALAFLWVYRRRVIFVLTGDDRFHTSWHDLVWYGCFKCCCVCDGEWTVVWSKCCCFLDGCCCSTKLQGKNLKKELARWLGLLPKVVVFRNIVAGDLPYEARHGDFYVTFDVGDNPPMNSSLSNDHNAKLVHFPETFSLRIRDNMFEGPLTVTVRELNVVGSENIARLVLPLKKYWKRLRRGETVQARFKLEPMGGEEGGEAGGQFPWILLEFEVQRELQLVDRVGLLTTLPSGNGRDVETKEVRMQDLKTQVPLRDRTGKLVYAKGHVEQDASEARKQFRKCWRCLHCLAILFFTAGFIALGTYRLMIAGCWREYRRITTAERYGYHDFPLPRQVFKEEVPNWNFAETTDAAILDTCANPPLVNGTNATHYRPIVLTQEINTYLHPIRDIVPAVVCYSWQCEQREKLMRFPLVSIASLGMLVMCLACFCCVPDAPTKPGSWTVCGEDDKDDDDDPEQRAALLTPQPPSSGFF